MNQNFDAVIIGAGPAGSSAAILLASAGWSVALIEKQSFPRRKVCGECIAASNYPLLYSLGIGDAFSASAGSELRKVVLMRGKTKIMAKLPATQHEGLQFGRALGRETLDTLLINRAKQVGATIFQPWSLQTINGDAGNWNFEIRDENSQSVSRLHASVAIAANGSWEPLPFERLERRLTRSSADLFAFKANFCNANLDQHSLALLSIKGGYGGMVIADEAKATLACCIRRDRLDELRNKSPGISAGEAVEAMLKRDCLGVKDALHHAVRVDSWLATGPISPGIRLGSRLGGALDSGKDPKQGLFRIGNAAGEAHPIIGEGMSMALQSAWLLCAYLLLDKNSQSIQDCTWQKEISSKYAAQWRESFASRLKFAASFAHIMMSPIPASSLFALLKIWPNMLTLGAKLSGKVDCEISPMTIESLAPKREMDLHGNQILS